MAGTKVSSAAALLELLPAPARARLIAPDLLSGDSGCGDTSFRLLTEFGRLAFASLLFADIGQTFEHIEAIPDLVDGKRMIEPIGCKHSVALLLRTVPESDKSQLTCG